MTAFRLGDIRPNPFRNVERYPIDRQKVDKLKESIGRTDFWDNLVARIGSDGQPEIGYGHHRMTALRELYQPDHEISLIVRDLDDAAMLHVMADENMTEWAASGAVIVETVRAVRDFLDRGDHKVSTGGRPAAPNGRQQIATFLGWNEHRVKEALSIINSEDSGEIAPEDTADLSIRQASDMRRAVTKIKDPVLKSKAIARVRGDLQSGAIGHRGIPDVVREVRQQATPPSRKEIVPAEIAKGIYGDIDSFWRGAARVNGQMLTRSQIIQLIAANRDAESLNGLARPWSEQIADALLEMARRAEDLAKVLRSENALAVAL